MTYLLIQNCQIIDESNSCFLTHCIALSELSSQVLLDARDKLRIPWEDETREPVGQHLMKYMGSMPLDRNSFLEYVPSIEELWKDSGIRQAYNRRAEYQLVRTQYSTVAVVALRLLIHCYTP